MGTSSKKRRSIFIARSRQRRLLRCTMIAFFLFDMHCFFVPLSTHICSLLLSPHGFLSTYYYWYRPPYVADFSDPALPPFACVSQPLPGQARNLRRTALTPASMHQWLLTPTAHFHPTSMPKPHPVPSLRSWHASSRGNSFLIP